MQKVQKHNQLQHLNLDGFTLGNSGDYNGADDEHVAWQWKANGGTDSK